MKTRVGEQLRKEAKRYRLQFACPQCAYFDPEVERCSEGYPIDEHRDPSLQQPEILFCKLFEAS